MNTLIAIDEKDLLLRLRDGDHKAFHQLYDRYSDKLIFNLIRLVKNDVLVEEIVQETFLTLWEKRETLDPEKSLGGFLFRISANKAQNIFKRSVYDHKMREYLYPILDAGYEQIETQLFRKENEKLLHELLDKLPPKQREVYTLCKLEGLTYQQASKRLNISESTINSHILRANIALKRELVAHSGLTHMLLLSIINLQL